MRKLLIFLAGIFLPFAFPAAADLPEEIKSERSDSLYQAAVRAFEDKNWTTAANWLGRYLNENPEIARRPKVLLMNAQALFMQKKYRECYNLLSNSLGQAEARSDEFNFWMAECRLRLGNNQAAAELFSQSKKTHKLPSRRAEACISESIVQSNMKHWHQAVEVLSNNGGPFKAYAKSNPKSELSRIGNFVLADAMLNIKGMENDAFSIIMSNVNVGQPSLLQERYKILKAYVLSRGTNDSDHQEAIKIIDTQLSKISNPLRSELLKIRAKIHTKKGNFLEAHKSWSELIHDKATSSSHRRNAILNKLLLGVAEGSGQNVDLLGSTNGFNNLLLEYDSPIVQYTLGELFLRQQSEIDVSLKSGHLNTNALIHAAACFEKVRKSQFDSLACEGLGWVGWLRNSFKLSAENFLLAAGSPRQRQAYRIKAAEAMVLDGNHVDAIKHCQESLSASPAVCTDRTRLLMVYAISNLNAGAIADAIKLAEDVLEEFISPLHRARAQLLLSRAHDDVGNRKRADAILKELNAGTEATSLKAVADLESVRPLLQEGEWGKAIQQYSKWIADHNQTAKPELIARVEFDLAWLFVRHNEHDKAKVAFKKYIDKYQLRPDAAHAQMWIADHYFNRGDVVNLANAERAYQKIYSKFTNANSELKYRAKIMAGHSANGLNKADNARTYFMLILNDKNCPAEYKSEAAFGLGNAAIRDIKLQKDRFDAAIAELNKVASISGNAADLLNLEARCRIGDCHLQMAAVDNRRYEKALSEYRTVRDISAKLDNDPPVRFRAILGMAEVLRHRKPDPDPKQALELYNEVFYGAGISENKMDQFWAKHSGLAVGRLHQELGQHQNAISTYQRLSKLFPKMKQALSVLINQSRVELGENNLLKVKND